MKKLSAVLILFLGATFLLTSCRPPELEGAFVDYKARRMENALKLAIEATEKYPENAEAPFLLGKIYGEMDQFAEMVEAFDKSLQRSSQHEKEINDLKIFYFQTEYVKGYDNYVAFQQTAGDTSAQAIKLLDMAIKRCQNATAVDPTDYRPIKLTGLAYNYKNENEEALKYFHKLTEVRPDTADAWYQIGRLHFNNRNFEKAAEYNSKAMELDPSFIPAVELLAFSYESLKDTANAILTYRKASEIEPNNVSFLFNLGLIYNRKATTAGEQNEDRLKYYAEAEELFGRAINLDPDQLDSYQRSLFDSNLEIMYSLKCIAQLQQRKFESCKDTALQGLEIFPDSSELYEFLAIAYANMGENEKAKEAEARAEQLKN